MYSIIFHEMAHALVSYSLGDRGAKSRLTLNPMAHFDPVGLFVFLFSLIFLHIGFGWAKPVMIDPYQYPDPRKGVAMVAAAGPLTNLVLGIIFAFLHLKTGLLLFGILTTSNNLLALFNLLPIPPLDGSRIVNYFFPYYQYKLVRFWYNLSGLGKLFVIVVGIYLFQSLLISTTLLLTKLEFECLKSILF